MHKICFTISFISCLYMFRAHVLETCRGMKLYLLWHKCCASSWLNTDINILRCTVCKTSKQVVVFQFPTDVHVFFSQISRHTQWTTQCSTRRITETCSRLKRVECEGYLEKSWSYLLRQEQLYPQSQITSLHETQCFVRTQFFSFNHKIPFRTEPGSPSSCLYRTPPPEQMLSPIIF